MSTVTIQKILDNGTSEKKIDLLIMGDGFTSTMADQDRFNTKVQEVIDKLFNIYPFSDAKTYFNVFKATVISNESGIDKPADGVTKDTALNTTYGTGDTERVITTTDGGSAILDVINQAEGDYAFGGQDYGGVVVLVNDTEYGGASAGIFTTTSIGQNGTYNNPDFVEIVAHELGHSIGGLADEYESNGDNETYTGSEPTEPNLTKETQKDVIKWKGFIVGSTPIPTLSKNGSCDEPDKTESTLAGLPEGTVGLFEGGGHWHCGVFRPEGRCKMRALKYPFCIVCQSNLNQNMLGRTLCFIATAAFGSSLDPHVEFLRSFRDDIVLQSKFRKPFELFLKYYYVFSPPIADKMRENQALKKIIKYSIVYPFIYAAKITAHTIIGITFLRKWKNK